MSLLVYVPFILWNLGHIWVDAEKWWKVGWVWRPNAIVVKEGAAGDSGSHHGASRVREKPGASSLQILA